jgi:hypothetical protein
MRWTSKVTMRRGWLTRGRYLAAKAKEEVDELIRGGGIDAERYAEHSKAR